MNYRKILLLTTLILPLFSLAQSNYKKGFVVTLKGDTLRGAIDYRDWDITPNTIKFKSETGKVDRLTVGDIDFFSVDNITAYTKYTGKISMDNTNADHMIEFRDTTFKVGTFFLKVLQKGQNVALYSYSDGIKERFFIGETPTYAPVELVYRLYYDMNAVTLEHGRTVNENTYMNQLYALALKYDAISVSLQREIEESGYREYNLVKVVSGINKLKKGRSSKN